MKISLIFAAILLNTACAEVCKYGAYETPTFGCVELCELEDRSREVITSLMSNNTRIVATNVTCENTAFQLDVCRKDYTEVIITKDNIIADQAEEIEEMKVEVSDREIEIDDKDIVIDNFTSDMSRCLMSIDTCQMQIDECFKDVTKCSTIVCDQMQESCGSAINVEVPMDIDSALMDTIVESEFELWASMPCFGYHTLRNVAVGPNTNSTVQMEVEDEAECWDSCDGDSECTAAVYNGIMCWHKTIEIKPSNVEYKMGYSTLVPCMPRNETMYQDLEDEAIHMGKIITYYNLELSACAPCTGYNKLHDIDTAPGVQIGDTIMNVSEADCWTSCTEYPDSGCSTAVFDGMNCALKNETVSNVTSRYSPGSHSLYACPPVVEITPVVPEEVPESTDRGIVIDFIQFKLDVNEQMDCTGFNRLNDTDVTPGSHILKACEVDTIEDCFDTCMAYSGSDDGPCTSAVYKAPQCWLKNVTITTETGEYNKNYTTIYPCDN